MTTTWRYLTMGAMFALALLARPAQEETNRTTAAPPKPGTNSTVAAGEGAAGAKTNVPAETSPSGEETASGAGEAAVAMGVLESLKTDKARLAELQAELENPESEYAKAERAAEELKKSLEELQKKAKALQAEGQELPEELAKETESIQTKAKLAEDRLKIAFEERRAQRDQVKALQEKIQKASQILARLEGESAGSGLTNPPSGGASSNATNVASSPQTGSPPAQAATEKPAPSQPPMPGPAGAVAAAAAEQPEAAAPGGEQPAAKPPALDLKLREAKAQEQAKKAEAEAAAQDAQLVQDKVLAGKQEIEAEEKLLETAQKKADLARAESEVLRAEIEEKRQAGAGASELAELETKLRESEARLAQADTQIEETRGRLEQQQAELDRLAQIQSVAVQDAEAKQEEAQKAEAKVKRLENPFHPRNLLQWLLTHGPKVGAILVLMFLANLAVRLFSRRIINVVARASSYGSEDERENRAKTLVSVFQSTASVVIVVGGCVMILDQVGVPVGPIIGGAAIIGLAVAFGAQRLISDFFHGFVMLLENQFKVNDVVRVAGIAGLVERITLRLTVLRDLEGIVHFIPNSEIKTVSNMTHGWSRALFEIGVAYKEDADRVMQVLVELGKELRQDPKYGPLILDDPEMLGLDSMSDSAIVIKFFLKTRPLQQWSVKRELLRRIKRRFDELGIEIPFPHRTVYLRSDSPETEPPEPAEEPTPAKDGPGRSRRGRR